jgi:hypothetical protein
MNIIPSSPRNASPALAGVALIYINMRLPGCAYLNRSAGSLRNVPAALAESAALLQLGASRRVVAGGRSRRQAGTGP